MEEPQHGVAGALRKLFTGAVGLVTIHHEGAGDPTDYPRGKDGGYSIWIGSSNFTLLRSPYVSWGTLDYNHVSVDICLSGNRMNWPVTDTDLWNIAAATANYRARGWLIDHPLVRDHHDSPGSNTVCSGDNTRARFAAVTIAATASAPVPPPDPIVKVKPMFNPGLGPIVACWKDKKGRVKAQVADNGDVYAWSVPHRDWPNQHIDFAGRHAAKIYQAEGLPSGRYTIEATSGEKYTP